MREELQPAYILHVKPYRNTSALVDFFTYDYGRVGAVVKGVYRQGKHMQRMRGQLRSGLALQISWVGKTELKTITHLEQTDLPFQLTDIKLFSALYINELLIRLLRDFDAYPGLFESYQQFLGQLIDAKLVEVPLRVFEFALLRELGFGIDFYSDAINAEPISADRSYRFDVNQGFVSVIGSPRQDANTLVLSGKQIMAIAEADYADEQLRRIAKRLTRMALKPHLGDKPLRSRELFVQITPKV